MFTLPGHLLPERVSVDRLLKLPEAAARLEMSPATLKAWRLRGEGPPAAKIGRYVVYRESQLGQWIDERFAAAAATRDGDVPPAA